MPDSQHRSGRDTDKTVLSGLAKQCELTFRCLRFRSISADDGSLDSTAKVAKISTVNGPLTKNVPRDSRRKPATTLCGKSKVKCRFLCVFTVCVVVVVFISSVFLFLRAKCKRQFSVPFLSCSCSRVDHVCVFLFS